MTDCYECFGPIPDGDPSDRCPDCQAAADQVQIELDHRNQLRTAEKEGAK